MKLMAEAPRSTDTRMEPLLPNIGSNREYVVRPVRNPMTPQREPSTNSSRFPARTANRPIQSVLPAPIVPPVRNALRLMHQPTQTIAVPKKPRR